jgi:hypothetical protein
MQDSGIKLDLVFGEPDDLNPSSALTNPRGDYGIF